MQQFCMYTLFLKFSKKLPLGWLKVGWEQPCFFNIFKQDLSKIEFEYYILDQHKKCFKMRPIKIILVVIDFDQNLPPRGSEGGVGPSPWQDWNPCHNFFFVIFIILGTNCNFLGVKPVIPVKLFF